MENGKNFPISNIRVSHSLIQKVLGINGLTVYLSNGDDTGNIVFGALSDKQLTELLNFLNSTTENVAVTQVGQKKFQYITIINSLYATSISETVISIINNFFVIVIKYYAEGNTLSQIFSGIASSLIYTFILRQEKLITARTQIIYFGIVLVLNSLIIYLTSFLK